MRKPDKFVNISIIHEYRADHSNTLSTFGSVQVTDVGLWCIARHTRALRELNVSGCHGVTNIGLRSLAICCDKMEQLDFTNCNRLTDLGLRVLGGGCW